MSQSVTRLKELLFDSESRQLGDLQRELEALARRQHEHLTDLSTRQTAITERADAAFERAGSDERLLKSVAAILDGALREAEVNRHEQLSRAIAPLVVKSIKYELKNSQAEMVDALYPITGRLVKQYVRAAMNDLMTDINRRLGGGRLSELEAQAKAQGVTVAELIFAEAQALKIDELFLVRRGSGELVAHWEREDPDQPLVQSSAGGGSNRDVLIAGYLSGITAFSEEAFDDKKGSLRSLDMDGERIFVRASPAYLLAARCSGSAPAAVEQIIDDEFIHVLQSYKDALAQPATTGGSSQADAVAALLPTLAASFERRFTEKRDEIELKAAKALAAKPRYSRLQIAATLLLLPLAAWGAWSAYTAYLTSRTQQAATAVVGTIEPLAGYPVQVDVARGGRAVSISGLAPTGDAKEQLTQRLQREVSWATVANNLTVLPAAQDVSPDVAALRRNVAAVDAELTTSAVRRSLIRTVDRLDTVARALPPLKDRLADAGERAAIDRALAAVVALRGDADRLRGLLATGGINAERQQALADLRSRIGAAEAQFASLAKVPAPAAASPATDAVPLSEDLALSAERIGGLVSLVDRAAIVAPVNRDLAALKQRVDGLKLTLTPREELALYIRHNAVFFDNNADLNNAAAAERVVARVAELLTKTDATLRVIGYTDERTGPTVNNAAVAQARADRVAAMLVEKGVSRERFVTVGRINGPDIARVTGAGTPNRRVEFDIVFDGEPIAR